jgi:ABC-type lipoprotein export system ATPase subunit
MPEPLVHVSNVNKDFQGPAGVIFQFFQLLPTLTVIENVMLPMDFCRIWKPKERPERAMMLLEQVLYENGQKVAA